MELNKDALDRHITGNHGEAQTDNGQTYLTNAGNYVRVDRVDGDYVFMERLGWFDCGGEYHAVEPESWAHFNKDVFRGLITSGAFEPAVMMQGGYPATEKEYIDGNMWRWERD